MFLKIIANNIEEARRNIIMIIKMIEGRKSDSLIMKTDLV